MPGFLGAINASVSLADYVSQSTLINKSILTNELEVQVRTIPKFEQDKLCYEDEGLVIITEGVIINSQELIKSTHTQCFEAAVKVLYKENGESFFSVFRGSFSGLVYDKQKQQLIVFTDHIGDKAIFYTQLSKEFYFGSELKYVTELLTLNEHTPTLDIAGAYSALTYGYMISDLSYVTGVHRLRGGSYLLFDVKTARLALKYYHQFSYQPNYELSDKEIIEKVDVLFSAAVQKQVAKNKAYGYADYAALSAGLDSRMTTFALSRIKNSDFTSFTYSPIGFPDQTTSAAIVKQLKNNYIFQQNNSGDLLLDIDDSILANDGLFMYYGAAVLKFFFDKLITKPIGIIHSGQLGDVFVGGSYNKKKENKFSSLKKVDMHSKCLSEKFYHHFDFDNFSKLYPDKEIFSTYNRGFMGINSGANLVFQQFTETLSPFCDVEFCEFCLTIPIEKRINNYIYDKWIMMKYGDAAKFKHNGTRIIGGGKWNELTAISKRVISKLKKSLHLNNENAIQSVTPLNVWSSRPEIRMGLDNYFNQHIQLLDPYPELQDDCKQLYAIGTALEQNQVLTLIRSVKMLLS